jgi:plasmid stabilization system protein ParE
MPQFAVEFHPLAADEAKAAEGWYRERNETASARFQRELDRAVDLISERPNTGSPRRRSDRCRRACAAAARILASALTGGSGGSKNQAHDCISEVIRSRTATSSRQTSERPLISSGLLRTLERYFTIERRGRPSSRTSRPRSARSRSPGCRGCRRAARPRRDRPL